MILRYIDDDDEIIFSTADGAAPPVGARVELYGNPYKVKKVVYKPTMSLVEVVLVWCM